MAEVKVVIGTKDGKTHKKVISGPDFEKFVGKKLGEKVRGEAIGLTGYELEITGGSDVAGFPMRNDVDGQARKKVLLAGGVGFKPKKHGQRKRRTIHGNTISERIAQINCKVVKEGKEPLDKLLGAEEQASEGAKEEVKPAAEAPKEEVKEEPKSEEKPAEEEPKQEESKPEEKPSE